MEKLLKYSVLRYSPSTVAGEKINLGIIFSEEKEGIYKFEFTKNFSRLQSFDDSINIDMLKVILNGIKEDVEETTLMNYKKKFDIEEYTRYFVNDYFFDIPKSIQYENLDDAIERLKKSYFRFDYVKKERPTPAEDRKLIEDIIISNSKEYVKDRAIKGDFDDNIKYDFITDKYNIKILELENKNLKRLINNAKLWAWNSTHTQGEKETLILYSYNEENMKYQNEFNIIRNIFKECKTKFVSVDEAMPLFEN